MNIELFKQWQGFVKGDEVETSELLGSWLIDKRYGKQVNGKVKVEPEKRNTRQSRKPKRS